MGLIKAAIGAAGGVLADQWKEYFYCEAISKDILATKGQKRTSGRSSNTKGSDNIITSGSVIAVADGQCMIVVDQGKVSELCAEPGEFVYDASTEPSIFSGKLSQSIPAVFKNIGKRFTFGGEPPKDQRVYYFNTKELVDNRFGTTNPVPFRVVDKNIGLDIDIAIRCNGVYSYKLVDPILFYTNVCGNVQADYNREEIDSMLKSEFLTALQPAFAKISDMGIRYSSLPGHTMELADAMNEVLTAKWTELRGLAIVSVGVNTVSAPKEDEDMIKQLQRSAVMRDPTMAAATLVGAQSDAMRAAASNEGGAMMGFMGMGFAQQAGGMNAQNLFAMGQQQQPPQYPPQGGYPPQQGYPSQQGYPPQQGGYPPPQQPASPPAAAAGWACACGMGGNQGKFCQGCGQPKPQPQAANGWQCACGTVNQGKFCQGCGQPKPAGAPLYRCDKCGWTPPDPANPPKFCPECGDIFDASDAT